MDLMEMRWPSDIRPSRKACSASVSVTERRFVDVRRIPSVLAVKLGMASDDVDSLTLPHVGKRNPSTSAKSALVTPEKRKNTLTRSS